MPLAVAVVRGGAHRLPMLGAGLRALRDGGGRGAVVAALAFLLAPGQFDRSGGQRR